MTYGNLNVKYSAGLLSRFIISTFNFTIRRFVRTILSVYRSSKRKLFVHDETTSLITDL